MCSGVFWFCFVVFFFILDIHRLLYVKKDKVKHTLLVQKVLWFVWVPAPVEIQSTTLNNSQESLYVVSCLGGVTGHSSHLQVYHQTVTFLVVKGHTTTGVTSP